MCQYSILLEKHDHTFLHSKDSTLYAAKGNQNPFNRRLYSHAFK